jgi:hypothetical protein
LGARNATPPLIENLKHADLRVSNSAREALKTVWGLDAAQVPETVQDWERLWEQSGSGVAEKIIVADLQPLIVPEEEFQNE